MWNVKEAELLDVGRMSRRLLSGEKALRSSELVGDACVFLIRFDHSSCLFLLDGLNRSRWKYAESTGEAAEIKMGNAGGSGRAVCR